MTFDAWRNEAKARSWAFPPLSSALASKSWQEAWINYWRAMGDYERAKADGVKDPGRPVPPHRSG